jgi:WD40 repeat protein
LSFFTCSLLAAVGAILLSAGVIGIPLRNVGLVSSSPLAESIATSQPSPEMRLASPSFSLSPIPSITPLHTPSPTATPLPAITWRQGKIVFVLRQADGKHTLYMMDLEMGGEPRLIFQPGGDDVIYGPWLSSDSSQVAFYVLYGSVKVLDIDNPDTPHSLSRCSSPTFSPDDSQIICHIRGESYFPIVDIQSGTTINTLVHGMSGAVLPAWSPSGDDVAFAVFEGQQTSIWRMNISGGTPIPLATEAFENYAPSWSPDGEWVAYQSTLASEESEIWIVDRGGEQRQQITFSSGNWSRGPAWSPDGKWIAFVSSQAGSIGADYGEVFAISLVTGEMQQITHTGGAVSDWRVTWGP